MTRSVELLTLCVTKPKEKNNIYHIFCFVYLDEHINTQHTTTTTIIVLRARRYSLTYNMDGLHIPN